MNILTSIEAFVKYHFGEYVEFERNSNASLKNCTKTNCCILFEKPSDPGSGARFRAL